MAAAKVEIIYEAEATSLKAVVNEVNKVNSDVVESAKQTSTKFANEFKNASKEAANAFANGQLNGAIKNLNTQVASLTTGLKLNTDAFKKFDTEAQKTNKILVQSAQDVAKYEDRLRELSVAGQRATQEFEDIAKAVGEYKSAIIAADRAVDLYSKSTDAATGRIGELEDKLYDLALAGKSNTQEFQDLVREVANVKRAIVETDKQVDSFVERSRGFGTVVQNIELVGNAFQVVEGAAALFGDENEELQKTLVKLQAITAITSGIEQARLILIEQSAKKTGIAAVAERAYGLAVGTSTGALKAFRIALAATGVGLIIVAIGALIANFDKLKDAIFGTSDTTRALKATLEGVRTAQAGAIEQTSKVGTAFELARKGVISKDEALLTYNETLGDSFGKTNDLNVAEANYVKKKEAFIQATAARAQAQALLAQSAALAAEAATVTGEQATNFGEKIQTFIGDAFGVFNKLIGNTAAVTAASLKANTLIVEQNAKERVQSEKTAQAEILTNLATSKLAEAEVIENGAGIASEVEQKVNEKRAEQAKAFEELLKEIKKASNESIAKLEEQNAEFSKNKRLSIEEAYQKELERLAEQKKKRDEKNALAFEGLSEQLFDGQINRLRRLEAEEGSTSERRIQLIELESQKQIAAIRLSVDDKAKADNQILRIEAETQQAIRDERKKSRDEAIDQALEIASASADALGSILKFQSQLTENRIAEIQSSSEKELEAINSSLESEVVKANKREALEKRTQSKIAAEKQKQARQEKALNIFRATIDTAASIVKTGAQLGYPAALPFQILAGIVGAANIAAIAAQPLPKFKKGGMVGGRSHEAGGTLIEAERGEYVVNKNSVMRNRRELDAINTSSAAFKRLIDERYVRPAILSYAMNNKRDGITVNASLNSKSMEKELKGLRKDMRNKNTIVNINGGDSRYSWQ
jgi:hypothetical protein